MEAGAKPTQEFTSVKSTLRALEEIESGNVVIHPDPEAKREAVRRRAEEAKRLAEEEERKIKAQIIKKRRRRKDLETRLGWDCHPGLFTFGMMKVLTERS